MKKQVLEAQIESCINELTEKVKFAKGQTLVVGCSTSEVMGSKIGSASNADVAVIVLEYLLKLRESEGINIAVQCCEHLNRALVVERKHALADNLEIVEVIPQVKAGGAAATQAFIDFDDPVVVEFITAEAGIDIGNTIIGMHLKHVVVPIKPENNKIGEANIVMARTRPKYIGGLRAVYPLHLDEK